MQIVLSRKSQKATIVHRAFQYIKVIKTILNYQLVRRLINEFSYGIYGLQAQKEWCHVQIKYKYNENEVLPLNRWLWFARSVVSPINLTPGVLSVLLQQLFVTLCAAKPINEKLVHQVCETTSLTIRELR